MNQRKVSVIIPIYNAAPFLKDCLNAILHQTLKDIEIICVNDGSTDESLSILRQFQREDDRIAVIDQENQGAGAARNAGLDIARGEYLSFLDADDFYEENMLEESYLAAKKADADVCVFYADLFDNSTGQFKECTWAFRRQYFQDQVPFDPKEYPNNENIFRMFNGWPWDKLFKREFIQKNGLYYQNLRTTNDMYFVFIALAKAERIVTLDKCLIHQRVEVKTSLSRNREKSWDCFYLGLKAMYEEMLHVGIYNIYKKAFLNWCVNFSLWQLNSMKGEAYRNVYNLLRDKAFDEFNVPSFSEEDFYSKKEYDQYRKIMETPLEENNPGNTKTASKRENDRIAKTKTMPKKVYLDVLNILACFAVVMLHCTSKAWDVDTTRSWYAAIILQGMFIWAVTVFFMLSGAKCMEFRKKYGVSEFLKKRLKIVVIPFALFSVFYLLFFSILDKNFLQSPVEAVRLLLNNEVVGIFWFFGKLIPLYFCIPIVAMLSRKMKAYFVALAFIANFLIPFVDKFWGLKLAGYTLPFVDVIVAVALLGYLLDTGTIKKKMRILIYLGGIFCTIASIAMTVKISTEAQTYLKTYIQSTSFTTIFAAAALWVFMKYAFGEHINVSPSMAIKIRKISACCFGVYLLQPIPLKIVGYLKWINVYSPWYSLVGSCVIFVICISAVFLVRYLFSMRKVAVDAG